MIKTTESVIVIISAIQNEFVFNNASEFHPIYPTPGVRPG